MDETFPHLNISLQIILALGVGLIVGLEREFAGKDIGLRSFSFASLFGLLCQLIGPSMITTGLIAILVMAGLMNLRSLLTKQSLEITTSVALLITFCVGILVGMNHVFTPVAVSILVTLFLAWKAELVAFTHGLDLLEIRSAVMLGLLTFVIYPILPDRFIDPLNLFNPKESWMTVIILAGISFINYILMKLYSTKGLYYSALLGGAVNSSAAVTEISTTIKSSDAHFSTHGTAIILMTTISMFIRNLFLLGILDRQAISVALIPLLSMMLTAVFFVWYSSRKRDPGFAPAPPLKVNSPVSLYRVLFFGIIFIIVQAAGTLSQKFMGSTGVLAVSSLGGMVSSASTTAAAAKLAAHGTITASLAGLATVLTSIVSAFINLPIVYQVTRNKLLTRKIAEQTAICVAVGLISMAFAMWIDQFFRS